MAESKPSPTQASPDKEVKAPNLIERAKEEIGAIMHTEKSHNDHKETHGMRTDIDEKTPLDNVKAPNMFERAKEEFEAIVEAIHPKTESPTHGKREEKKESKKQEKTDSQSENNAKTTNFIGKAKEKIGTIMHHEKSPKLHDKETHDKSPKHHTEETHGTSDDIDANIPIDHVKAPNVFERAKEEIEAIVQSIHPKKKEKNPVSSPKKEGGL
ncbi:hypothetical protein PRUPE_7G206700 [Prunus persica]|uniref:Uncharacterized protein n=1 Tax=Prunus persica TaxID=3760 RepID=A0A251NGG4_PRUPE|nr:uncharacterized protein LOC18771582 [Prunus persica]ONH97719.1 hypothetical protein PRUPE_7G206700 [Prunus persica]